MTGQAADRLKLCYVLSYRDPNYIRTSTILNSIDKIGDIDVYRAINTSKGIKRYLQTIAKLITIRLKYHPDAYLLGFRGLEIFWLVRLITAGKPLIYDEFIEPVDWFTTEHQKFGINSLPGKALRSYNHWVLKSSTAVLADTTAHAMHSAKTNHIAIDKYCCVPVSTDESVFKPSPNLRPKEDFIVFFYGSMLPLHGVEQIFKAIPLTASQVKFHIVGGQLDVLVNSLPSQVKKRVKYENWIPFQKLPEAVAKSSLCIGGPLGGTSQSMRVITGKTFQFLAMGKPVIIGKTNVVSPLNDKQNCLIVEQKSPESLARAINWAYENKDQLGKLGRAGLDTYQREYSNEVLASKLRQLFIKLNLLKDH